MRFNTEDHAFDKHTRRFAYYLMREPRTEEQNVFL